MRTLLLVLLALVATATPASAATPLEAGTQLAANPTGFRCVNGLNVRGHLLVSVGCARHNPSLPAIGPVVAIRETYGVVRIADPTKWQQLPRIVGSATLITGSVEAPIGATVCASGPIAGWRCGVIQAKNQNVSYPDKMLTGMTRTSLCAYPGEDWVPVVSGSNAQGHLIGGSTSGGCMSFFYPINKILAAEGFTLVTA